MSSFVEQHPPKMAGGSSRDEFGIFLREWRHNHCLMTPVAAFVAFCMALSSLIALVCSVPQFVLGLLIAPLLKRGNYLIEFLYPTSLVGWGHLTLVRLSQRRGTRVVNGKAPPPFARAIEQRIEVIPQKVYIHPIPLLLDNVGYVIVFLSARRIEGYVVDCSDSLATSDALQEISKYHYDSRDIVATTILSTHKHHDHTGGNSSLGEMLYVSKCRSASTVEDPIHIYGGAVERVPYCTHFVQNGDLIPLPSNLKELQLKVIATPSHTRGSVVYALTSSTTNHLFTGDTMFSGGGGVPFEADTEYRNPQKALRPSAGNKSLERCFSEILVRSGGSLENTFVYAGHDYTSNLLGRQLDPSKEFGKFWNQLSPSQFFITASYFLTTHHWNTLPKGTKLLTLPNSLQKELIVNPHFRSLKRRGEKLVTAVLMWRQYYKEDLDALYQKSPKKAEKKLSPRQLHHVVGRNTFFSDDESSEQQPTTLKSSSTSSGLESAGSNSSAKSWTLTPQDLNRSVFTTVYSADLNDIIQDLLNNKSSSSKDIAQRLMEMSSKLDETVVTRRPVPNTLPSVEQMFQGCLALAILGAPPSAMTPSDSIRMNLPKPVNNSDYLLISKTRILNVLCKLGLIADTTHGSVVHAFHLLWEVAQCGDLSLQQSATTATTVLDEEQRMNTMQDGSGLSDVLDLGLLKYTLYGAVGGGAPQSNQGFWSRFCCPCNSSGSTYPLPFLPPPSKKRRQTGAELIRHDMQQCCICKDVIGCPHLSGSSSQKKQPQSTANKPAVMAKLKSNKFFSSKKQSSMEVEQEEELLPEDEEDENDVFKSTTTSSPTRMYGHLVTGGGHEQQGFEMEQTFT